MKGDISGDILFRITVADMRAVLDEGEFDAVWAALGKVARASAKAKARESSPGAASSGGADVKL